MERKTAGVSASSKEKNEYIPQFISKKPFYLSELEESATSDYLEHQRIQNQSEDTAWYDRGKRLGPAATKFRKGACENCGAMTHKVKECLDRPRKQGARWTGKDIQADEMLQTVRLGWDAKRDRWNGYDAKEYKAVVEEYEQMEEIKLKLKQKLALDKKLKDPDAVDSEEEDVEDAKYTEESGMGRQQGPATRNLRIREDTAKYLLNLDLDSAKYDPKTRSMVDSGATADRAAAFVAEDNFMRASGDAAEFAKAQLYAWETQERGDKNKLHLQANPTSGELDRKKQQESREIERLAQRKKLLDRYGGSDSHDPASATSSLAPAAHMALLTSSDHFVEYDDKGRVKGRAQHARKSKYAEDVFPNNHTSVWGSWWANFQWGYACCHSSVRNSYCTGAEGKQAWAAERAARAGGLLLAAGEEETPGANGGLSEAVDLDSTSAAGRKRRAEEISTASYLVTDEAMDEYRRKRPAADDPMAAFLGTDGLVH